MIVLKILAAPVMVALSLLAAMVTFLFCVASAVCELGCIVLTLLSLILFIGGQTVGGIVFLVLAFLVSPFGVPAIIARFHNLEAEEGRERTEKSFFVHKDEIVGNDYDLSINKYKKTEYVHVEYPSTAEVMTDLHELEMQITAGLAELEEML